MDARTSLTGQADSAPREAHESWWGRVLLLALAFVVALPVIYLAFTSAEPSLAVSSAPAVATAGPPATEVTVAGEVLHPGRHTLLPDERVASAVLRAGGFTSSARDTVKVIQSVPGRGNVTRVGSLRNVLTKPMPGGDNPFCLATPLSSTETHQILTPSTLAGLIRLPSGRQCEQNFLLNTCSIW